MSQPEIKYCVYPTLLDSFHTYLHSQEVWETYWGLSDNPSKTAEEFEEEKYKELIDKINRVPQTPSEAAAKGTSFNDLVDFLLHGTLLPGVKTRIIDYVDEAEIGERSLKCAPYVECECDGFVFKHDLGLMRRFADYYGEGTMSQVFTSGVLDTKYGAVSIYGFIDEIKAFSIHDIKTVGKYTAYKFKDHWQHIIYPFCLHYKGNKANVFEYNVTDFKDVYTETYVYNEERDVPRLREFVEDFIEFLEEHRDVITDGKIFNNA